MLNEYLLVNNYHVNTLFFVSEYFMFMDGYFRVKSSTLLLMTGEIFAEWLLSGKYLLSEYFCT